MYTAEQDQDGHWEIFDPDGDFICTVQEDPDAILSHLNKGE